MNQQDVRAVFKGAVVVAGVVAGIFFVWFAFAHQTAEDGSLVPLLDGFLRTLSFIFGATVIVAAICFPFLES